jgi:hypothetical protein
MILSSDSYTQIIVTITVMVILSIIGVLCMKYWDKIIRYFKFHTSTKVAPEIVVLQKIQIDTEEVLVN